MPRCPHVVKLLRFGSLINTVHVLQLRAVFTTREELLHSATWSGGSVLTWSLGSPSIGAMGSSLVGGGGAEGFAGEVPGMM